MNLRYTFFAVLLFILGGGLLLLPEKDNTQEMAPETLMAELKDKNHFFSTDEIADRIINQDPTLLLIDVRLSDNYFEYSIPGALNIPIDDILNPEWDEYIAQDGMDVVFYSNSDVSAEQAFLLLKRMKYDNLYVMKGGLNCWFETIIKPVAPVESAPNEEIDLYQFRKGASIFFVGGQQVTNEDVETSIITVSRKKKASVVEGGC